MLRVDKHNLLGEPAVAPLGSRAAQSIHFDVLPSTCRRRPSCCALIVGAYAVRSTASYLSINTRVPQTLVKQVCKRSGVAAPALCCGHGSPWFRCDASCALPLLFGQADLVDVAATMMPLYRGHRSVSRSAGRCDMLCCAQGRGHAAHHADRHPKRDCRCECLGRLATTSCCVQQSPVRADCVSCVVVIVITIIMITTSQSTSIILPPKTLELMETTSDRQDKTTRW